MKNKNITRIFTLFLALCMCFSMMSTTAFAATSEPIEKDYMNYDFPENAEIIYQGEDGVIYSTPSENVSEEQISPRTLTYNQVWVDAGKTEADNFYVTNPYPSGSTGFGRLRLESNASDVTMQVVVLAGLSVFVAKTTIKVGTDITFDFNSTSNEITVKYYTGRISSSHGMRLNCWLS